MQCDKGFRCTLACSSLAYSGNRTETAPLRLRSIQQQENPHHKEHKVSVFVARLARAVSLAALTFASPALAQAPALRDLPKPSREIEEPFSLVSGALELKPNQLLAVDGTEAMVMLVDFAKGTRTNLGRQGSGPGEYRMPAGLFRLAGDTLWLFDAMQQRLVVFNPDLTPGTTMTMLVFDQSTSTALTAPYLGDRKGMVYASSMVIQAGRSGGNMQMSLPDSVGVIRMDPRGKTGRTELARVRFPTSGKPDIKQNGSALKYTMAYPGLVASDPWTVFPDGRVAIVRGATYTVEYITPDGKKTTTRIAYDPIKVTAADQKAEMDEAKRVMAEQGKMVQKMMPPNVTMDFELLPPAEWPANYPAVSALGALPGPDGRLWVRRAIPFRTGHEQWDVIDQAGKLVARWRLPAKTTLVALGQGVVYTVRTDEDDLRYLQRVEIGK